MMALFSSVVGLLIGIAIPDVSKAIVASVIALLASVLLGTCA
jgi:hypothetical protein